MAATPLWTAAGKIDQVGIIRTVIITELGGTLWSYQHSSVRQRLLPQFRPCTMVLLAYEQRIVWFILREGVYQEQQPRENSVLKSEVFPGLWLLPDTLLRGEMSQVLQILQRGLASPEHKTFTATLTTRKGKPQ